MWIAEARRSWTVSSLQKQLQVTDKRERESMEYGVLSAALAHASVDQ